MKTTGILPPPDVPVTDRCLDAPVAERASPLSLGAILAAQTRLTGIVRETPCTFSEGLSATTGADLFLKHEHLQRTRSFKERGAANALLCLSAAERRRGVVAASAGNHGLGLALHGARMGIPVTLVIPVHAPRVKADRCRSLGAQVRSRGATFEEADRHARELAAENGARYVHPFDDLDVMAGQGTVALEILRQVPDVEVVALPVGGGGLLAGAALALRRLRPEVQIVAVEPERAPCFLAARRSGARLQVPVQPTLADGLAVSKVGGRPFAAARDLVDAAVLVAEVEIASAMVHLFEAERIVAEGAGAVAPAAVLCGKLDMFKSRRVVALVGGANVDAQTFARALRLGLGESRGIAPAVI